MGWLFHPKVSMSSGAEERGNGDETSVDYFYGTPCMCVLPLNELCARHLVSVMKRSMACLIALLLLANLIRGCRAVRHFWSSWTDKNQTTEVQRGTRVERDCDGGEGWG